MLLDAGVGILLSVFISSAFSIQLSVGLAAMGILFALLPDIDFWIEFALHGSVGGKVVGEHRAISHFPITYIPVIALAWYVWGGAWALFLGAGLFSHLIHDSMGIGWGIAWLWPFSSKVFKCFSEKNGDFSTRLVVAWSQEELVEVAAVHGDTDWIRNIYLKAHPINLIESYFFLMSIVVLALHVHLS